MSKPDLSKYVEDARRDLDVFDLETRQRAAMALFAGPTVARMLADAWRQGCAAEDGEVNPYGAETER